MSGAPIFTSFSRSSVPSSIASRIPDFSSAFSDFCMCFPALTHQYTICIIESDNTKGQVSNMANEKLKFTCDYMEGAHPLIMKELLSTNMMQTSGYEQIVQKAIDEKVDAIGLSGLITPSLEEMVHVARQFLSAAHCNLSSSYCSFLFSAP